ncbi:MAG: cation:dicarboxylate symporter family transporter [Pseudomonadota bacterium]
MIKLKLHWQILIALLLAVIAGSLAGTSAEFLGVRFYAVFDFIGTLFLNALKMLIVPLVVSSIVVGIACFGSGGAFGRLGLKTLLYYLTTSLFAILVGLVIVNTVAPGIVDGAALYECVAAIPSASLVAIAIILAAVGLPVGAIGLILAIDACRTCAAHR